MTDFHHRPSRRMNWRGPFLYVATLVVFSSGCEIMQWLHPRQLWKMNRQPAPRSEEDYFSIPDPPRLDKPVEASSAEFK